MGERRRITEFENKNAFEYVRTYVRMSEQEKRTKKCAFIEPMAYRQG